MKGKQRAIEIIRDLKSLSEGDEKLAAAIRKQLNPYRSGIVARREDARKAAGLISELVVYYGNEEDIQQIIQDEFFEEESTEETGFREINESSVEDVLSQIGE